jgi:hypothetical protein
MFKEKHPNVQVMLSKFESLKPWFVRKLHEWNTCYYWYHIEISKLKEGLNGIKSQAKGVHGQCNCSCTKICHPSEKDIDVQ